jgi:hypothetical protein
MVQMTVSPMADKKVAETDESYIDTLVHVMGDLMVDDLVGVTDVR